MTNRRTRQIWKQTLIASQSLSNTWKYRDIIRGPSKVETQNFESHKKGCAETEMEGRTSLMRLLPGRCKILRLYRVTPSLFRTKTGCARIFKSKFSSRLLVLFLRKIIRNIHNTPMNQTDVKHGIDSNHNCKCCIIISIRSDNSRKVLYNICTFLTHVMNTLLWWVAVVFQT